MFDTLMKLLPASGLSAAGEDQVQEAKHRVPLLAGRLSQENGLNALEKGLQNPLLRLLGSGSLVCASP